MQLSAMTAQVPTPECQTCGVLMRWHSEHRIMDGDRPARMQVFQCPKCEQLRAKEGYYGPA